MVKKEKKRKDKNLIWFILGLITLVTSFFGYLYRGTGISIFLGIIFGCILLIKKDIGRGIAIIILNILFGILGIIITLSTFEI